MRRAKPSIITASGFAILFLLVCLSIRNLSYTTSASARMQSPVTVSDEPVISTAQADPRDEPSIAVSRTNPQVIVGASKWIDGGASGNGNTRVAYYYSSDGGATWGNGVLGLETSQRIWDRASEPSVASDLNGNFYLCALMLDNFNIASGIYVFKSTDNGRTFQNPLKVVLDLSTDNPPKRASQCFLTIDTSPASPLKNTLYVTWVSSEEPVRTVILLSHLRPGEASFSEPSTMSHSGGMQGPTVTTGPNGEVYGAWEGVGATKVILFNASTDGGETFLSHTVAPSIDIRLYEALGSLSSPNPALTIFPITRMNSFPKMDVDRSNGPNRGMIYVALSETRNQFDADISVVKVEPPNGLRPNISPPVRANDDGINANQFFPWLSVDPTNGDVEVAFYDRRNDSTGTAMDLYLARSTDGGSSFAGNVRVSSVSSDATIQANVNQIGIGDYIGLQALNGKAQMMWTDTRRGAQEIFFGKVEFDASGGGGGGGSGPANDDCQSPHVISALPFQDEMDTRQATVAQDDPGVCGPGPETHSVWYSITPTANTQIGFDTSASDYDTILSVFTGSCGSLTSAACNDDFVNSATNQNRALLVFQATAGTTYLIEVNGKGSGGTLRLHAGYPTITAVEYTTAPGGAEALKITGAGFVTNNLTASINKAGDIIPLPTITFTGSQQGDGSFSQLFITRKKLRKVIKPGNVVTLTIESPAASGHVSNPYLFTRPR